MKFNYLLIILFLFYSSISFSQTINSQNIKSVLVKGKVDTIFTFGKWTDNGGTELQIKYLGNVILSDGRVFKVLNASFYFGLSHRANARILIYNAKNQYVGCYLLNMIDELPLGLKNGFLLFNVSNQNECKNNTPTQISLLKGLPKHLLLPCNEGFIELSVFSGE